MNAAFKRYFVLGLTILLLGWLWQYFVKYRPWDIRIPPINTQVYVPDYEFSDIILKEISGTAVYYSIKAKDLTLDKQKGKLTRVNGNMLNHNQPVFYFTADSGVLEFNKATVALLNFNGNTIKNDSQPTRKIWYVRGQTALWNQRERAITIEKLPVLTNGDIKITSTSFKYYVPFQYFMIGPECDIKSDKYHIVAQKAVLKDKIDAISLEEKVVYESKELVGRSDQMEVLYSAEEYSFKKNVFFEYKESALQADLITFNAQEDVVYLQGNVKFAYGDVNVYSDKALLKRKEDLVEFYENTKGWQGRSVVQSNQLVFDITNKTFVSSGGGRTKLIKNNND